MSRGPAALLALLLGLVLLPGQASAQDVDQRYPMPATGTVVIEGRGYGHGHGMSQWGAQGAAKQGRTWQQIVGFYYPGTEIGTVRRRVRVLISADRSPDVVVGARPRLRVKDLGSRERWLLPDNGASLWRIHVNRRGRSVLAYRTDRWHRFRRLDGDAYFTAGGKPMTLHLDGTTRQYRGRLISARPAAGSHDRDTVNALSIDSYLKGVVPHEVPALWEHEALRAQAVAARTYAAYERSHPRAGHYQICDTSACQVYGGYSAEHPRTNAAVDATRRVILTHAGEPAFTQFSASSGGWTSANQFGYLPAQEDPYDGWAGNYVHQWELKVDVSRIERAYPWVGNLREIQVLRRDGNGEWGGRVWDLRLVGTKDGEARRVDTSGDTFRYRLGLRSRWFSFR